MTATTQQSASTFATEELPLAAFLHASRALRFTSCEPTGNDRVAFVFADPNHEGDKLQLQFESGAECPAAAFYDSIRLLRKVMDRTRSRSNEQNEYRSHRR
jgi:hypothetical protein